MCDHEIGNVPDDGRPGADDDMLPDVDLLDHRGADSDT
jgi:hypothetical protein